MEMEDVSGVCEIEWLFVMFPFVECWGNCEARDGRETAELI
jgi:hypothetical protein